MKGLKLKFEGEAGRCIKNLVFTNEYLLSFRYVTKDWIDQ